MKQRCLLLAAYNFFAIIFFLLIFFVIFSIRFRIETLTSNRNLRLLNTTSITPPSNTNFSLLIGILTRPDTYNHRHFLRLVYAAQPSPQPVAEIDIRFVLCNITEPEHRMLVSLEILRFNDIVILDCVENMNSGKTYTYFSSLPTILDRRYDYIMKADDDIFIRLEPLAASLATLPRRDMYYGFVIPCTSTNPYKEYMSGMGFVLSWDIVEWIASSEIPRNHTQGTEDKLVGRWLNMGGKAKNRFTDKPAMYDYPGTNKGCSHELISHTVAVHKVKRLEQWLHLIRFFNVTKEIKQSKAYNL